MKHVALILCLLLTSCHTITVMCVEQSEAQYQTALKQYGADNVQLWRLKNANQNTYKYHAQAKVRINGEWYWIPNRPYTEAVSRKPQVGCTVYKRIK